MTRDIIIRRTLELAKNLNYPVVEFAPGNSVGGGERNWNLFTAANLTSRIELALVALRKMSEKKLN